ncbi:MAG: scyllo-inositol 2-dehydrogenase (NADP(+)) IolU [Paracidovorax wautersii]|uniref:Scyllo-inositol 2-dehydrogenase (NADP(+)) IolU n=1 Tax=Paracidovorax wautersii TaxID=1177982 RepID=A0A7V8JQB8_9BURK|nr:MAG: scyllo-inositol 2-dehydrogenase (NADP(+)) IolU [Paracidovorax wautersii]
MTRRLTYAMVGGGQGAFIGAVHRHAAALDGRIELVGGAFSSTAERARASGRALGLPDAASHARWQDLLEAQLRLPAGERIDFVTVVTPNHLHFEVAHAFADAGIGVVCDKPLVHSSAQAEQLQSVVDQRGGLFAVTYNYSGYPMVRQAREMVCAGAIGTVRKVVVEYHQGWLATQIEGANKQAGWRVDPARSGLTGAIGDIGSHAENLVHTVTGLEIDSLCADLATVVDNRALDDDGSVLLRFTGGARGVLLASQIATGYENDLKLRVFGSEGSLAWRQESPNELHHLPLQGPRTVLTRHSPWLHPRALAASRLPPGHPEGFIEAFANIYQGVADDLLAREAGQPLADDQRSYPTLADGARGVAFIEKTVASSRSAAKWTAFR